MYGRKQEMASRMIGYADGRLVMPAVGLGEMFYVVPLLAPATREPYERIGLTDIGSTYFATRSAPLGAVPVETVIATFFGWYPGKVRRYLPPAWESTTPAKALHAQRVVVDATLRRALGSWIDSPEAREMALLMRKAAEDRDIVGRPLFSAFSALPWPDPAEAHMTIWHAFALLREFRGDSHLAVLVANNIDACECHLMMAAAVVAGCQCHQSFAGTGTKVDVETPPNAAVLADREWPVSERKAALGRLTDRGLLTADGDMTAAGMQFHLDLERQTDRAATSPWEEADNSVDRLNELLPEPVGLLAQAWNLDADKTHFATAVE
ncbi:SCO6745 family protein [Gordonia terrae]|uniref:SCO6745 family protein n=1 Tax=Gordonia terrae TaxID=2055 RepID=UPI003F6C23E5